MKRFFSWCKTQPVLCISFLAALITIFIIPPDTAYLSYCNRSVLIQLFCLMITVAGFRSIGLFEAITQVLLQKSGNIRKLGLLLMHLCFLSAMLVTNDVALLTFVPFTLLLFQKIHDAKSLIWIVILETVAANLGSMLTPIGNPQNLYLYAQYQLHAGHFLTTVLPVEILSYLLLLALTLFLPKTHCNAPVEKPPVQQKLPALCYLVLFLLCLAAVFRLVPDWACLIVAIVFPLILNRSLFQKVDYALLATFVCFFVFVGNLARIDAVRQFFSGIMQGHELLISALLSQCISNVPAAVMLSGFTENVDALLLGVNIGGLGTPIASLASLISYQFYSKSEHAKSGRYLLLFSAVNFGLLALLLCFAMVWKMH